MKGLTLNEKDQARLQILNKVIGGELVVPEASMLMGLSERQVWRILADYRKDGAAALAHGNLGRKPINATGEETKRLVQELAQGLYQGVNHSHLTELLEEREDIKLSRSSVRNILNEVGLKSPRHRRPPQHRCRRERYPQEGMLLQIDGSNHDWLEGRGPYLTLVGAVDDATGTVPYALFREQEDAQGYFMLLLEIITNKGIPLALYSDRHGIFQRSPGESETIEEQLCGERQPTQFGRALKELNIQSIFALSPQAKGRIERLWGTFQDRLVSELRLARANTLEEANKVLWNFLPRFNTRFGVPASVPGIAYRCLEPGLCLEAVLCFKYPRTVAADNTISFFGQSLQLLPEWDRPSYAHARVEVQERLDGSLVVAYHGQMVATQKAPPQPVTLRARKGARAGLNSGTGVVATVNPPAGVQASGVAGHSLCCDTNQSPNKIGSGSVPTARKPSPNHPWRKWVLTKSLNN